MCAKDIGLPFKSPLDGSGPCAHKALPLSTSGGRILFVGEVVNNAEKWREYERRKRAIQRLNLDPIQYEQAILALARELGI